MKITLKGTYIAGRLGVDQKKHAPGTVHDLPKAEAERLIAAQHAVPASQDAVASRQE